MIDQQDVTVWNAGSGIGLDRRLVRVRNAQGSVCLAVWRVDERWGRGGAEQRSERGGVVRGAERGGTPVFAGECSVVDACTEAGERLCMLASAVTDGSVLL